MNGTERKVYAVSELTRLIRAALERAFGSVWVEGEISNLRRPSSGHLYFTLKDEGSQINAVLFRGDQRGLSFTPKDGQVVRVFGDLSVYERSGAYQVIVRRMEPGGKGALQAQFEALKAALLKEGLFEPSRKRPIPMLPQHVGVVTSPTGAAIRDILNVVSRRFPNLHIVLAPARVQGEGAAAEIAAAIDLLNARGGIDVMIVGRGGGSLEDLWAFNEEPVARAVARSRIPVISAVGHEIDFTICDFVADLRAPTPSAAAELVVGRKEEFEQRIDACGARLGRALGEAVLHARNRLLRAQGSYVFREPANLAKQYLQRLDSLELRMAHEVSARLGEGRQRLEDLRARMGGEVRIGFERRRQATERLSMQLRALNPLAVLGRGYSITTDSRGRVVKNAGDVSIGERVCTRLGRGRIESAVEGIVKEETVP